MATAPPISDLLKPDSPPSERSTSWISTSESSTSDPLTSESLFRPTLIEELIQKEPWRYSGYKMFSEWFGSSGDFFTIRRYDSLSARVILLMQWELTKLEMRLDTLDVERSHEVVKNLCNGSAELDDVVRSDLLRDIRQQLRNYHEFVNSYANVRKLPAAPQENIANVQNWFATHRGAIQKAEASFIDDRDDLIAINPTFSTPLRAVLKKLGFFQPKSVKRRRHGKDATPVELKGALSWNSEDTVYQNNRKISSLLNIFGCEAGFALLATPLWTLLHVSYQPYRVAIITVCIAVFHALIQLVSMARPYEATVVYATVLIVLLSIVPGGPLQESSPSSD